jgi:hypothetical protein
VKEDLRFRVHDGCNFYRNRPDFSTANRLKLAIKVAAYNYPVARESVREMCLSR